MIQYSYEERSYKEIIVEQRRQLFNKTEVEVEKRKHYEETVESIYVCVVVIIDQLLFSGVMYSHCNHS